MSARVQTKRLHALKSMGNTLAREAKDSINGAGLNLKLLKDMFSPPPGESQRAHGCASTSKHLLTGF